MCSLITQEIVKVSLFVIFVVMEKAINSSLRGKYQCVLLTVIHNTHSTYQHSNVCYSSQLAPLQ
jgi:hypothetical protein